MFFAYFVLKIDILSGYFPRFILTDQLGAMLARLYAKQMQDREARAKKVAPVSALLSDCAECKFQPKLSAATRMLDFQEFNC